MQWSETPSNVKGLLADMASGSGTSLTRGLISYDVMGNITTMWQCAPSICGTASQDSRPALSYSYDLAGNMTVSGDGATGNILYGRSPVGEVTSITNGSYTDPTNTPNLVSNVVNGPFGPISYQLGNGLGRAFRYDGLGRLNAEWVCSGSSQQNCSGGTQLYNYNTNFEGAEVLDTCDSVVGQCYAYGYDEFGRVASASVYAGPVQNFSYVYDRYGNRTQQNAPQGGPASSYSFNTATNQNLALAMTPPVIS